MFKKVLFTVALIGAAAAVAGLGTYATFTSTASAVQGNLVSGQVSINVPAAGATNRLTLGASGILPGDTMQRAVDLVNNAAVGSDALSAITLTTTASPTSLLDTDATRGLQLLIDSCSNAWTEAGVSPAYTYTCTGTTKVVLASTPLIVANQALANLASLATGVTDHLRVTLTFPVGTVGDNLLATKTSAITYAFTGTQRAGQAK
jgi:spore coat-associated protein N